MLLLETNTQVDLFSFHSLFSTPQGPTASYPLLYSISCQNVELFFPQQQPSEEMDVKVSRDMTAD
jgi:hypothetical protein